MYDMKAGAILRAQQTKALENGSSPIIVLMASKPQKSEDCPHPMP